MRVKCPRETMYTRDYSLQKSEIKLYAVRIIVKEKNEENRKKKENKKYIVQSMSIRLNGRLGTWLGTAPATWRATCACALLGRLRSRRPRLFHSACVAADSSLPRCYSCSSWGAQDSLGALPARAVTSRAPEEPIQPTATEPSALVRRPRSYCRARVARARALDLHSALRLGRRSRALRLGDVRLGPEALGSQD